MTCLFLHVEIPGGRDRVRERELETETERQREEERRRRAGKGNFFLFNNNFTTEKES